MTSDRPRTISTKTRAAGGVLRMAALLLGPFLSGCTVLGYLPPEKLPYAQLAIPYNSTQLKTSTTLEVLNVGRSPAYQFKPSEVGEVLLTQSDTIVAFSGRSKDSRKSWLNMIVFDEYRLTATRKYFFAVDERAELAPTTRGQYLIPPRRGILFDCQFIIGPDILSTPYATEEAQKIATIRWLAGQFKTDMTALLGGKDNPARGSALVSTCGMMVNQMLAGLLVTLDKSPGLAQNLGSEQGVEFPHIALGNGRVQMLVQDDVATMRIRVNFPFEPLSRP
jgi:hypothetical protein